MRTRVRSAAMAASIILSLSSVAAVDLAQCNKDFQEGLRNKTITPNDHRFYFDGHKHWSNVTNIRLTIEGCEASCHKPTFDLYDDWWPRLLTWLLPALLLVGNLHIARVGTFNRFCAMLHFIGDPIDSMWALLTKAEVWNRFHVIARRHTPPGPGSDAMARALAAMLAAFEELLGDMDSVHQELEAIVGENGAGFDQDDLDHIMLEAAEELIDSRSNEVLRTGLVIFNYLWAVLAALVTQIGGPQSSTPGGRIATAMFLSWLITVVMLSNTLSGFVSRRTCLRIMERYCRTVKGRIRDQHVFPNSPVLAAKTSVLPFLGSGSGSGSVAANPAAFIDAQPWSGSLYNYRPTKMLIRGDDGDRSPLHLLLLAVSPVAVAVVCAFVIMWFTPTKGLDCRGVWILASSCALFVSPLLTKGIHKVLSGRVAWYVMIAKDAAIGLSIMTIIICSSVGVFNTCWCWSAAFSRGTRWAYISLDPEQERKYNGEHIYAYMVGASLGLQLLIYGLMYRIMRPGGKVFRPDEDEKMDVYRRVHNLGSSPDTEMDGRSPSSSRFDGRRRRHPNRASSETAELLLPPATMSPNPSPQLRARPDGQAPSGRAMTPSDYFGGMTPPSPYSLPGRSSLGGGRHSGGVRGD